MPPQVNRPIVTEEEAVIALPRTIPRTKPTPIPMPGILDEPTYCIRINKSWAGHLLGVIMALDQPDTWTPDEVHDIEWARLQVKNWVAQWLTEDMCMPCCDDLVEQLTNLVTINTEMLTNITTIVTNLTTVINNQLTVINQGDTIIDNDNTAIYNQYLNQYNDFVNNNSTQQTWNNMFYDGTPQSVAPNAGDNFSDDGDAHSEDILCAAVQRFVSQMMGVYGTQAMLLQGVESLTAGTLAALGVAFGLITGGQSAVLGIALGALILTDAAQTSEILNDTEAQRKVRCCIFDALKGQPITEDNFKTCCDGCGFDPTSHEGLLLEYFQNSVANYRDDYLGFLQAYQSSSTGNAADCECGCGAGIVASVPSEYIGAFAEDMGDGLWRVHAGHIPGGSGAMQSALGFKTVGGACCKILSRTSSNGAGTTRKDIGCDGTDSAPYEGLIAVDSCTKEWYVTSGLDAEGAAIWYLDVIFDACP